MSQIAKWFERKFDLSFPAELYPNVCVRLRGTPARLEELMRGHPKELLVKREEGKWSMQENAGHLLDVEPLWLTRVEDFIAGASELTATDLKNRKTHEANHNSRVAQDILVDFRHARMKLLERVSGFEPSLFSRTALHPRLKTPMRLVDHLYFVAEHDDHHLARIWELGNAQ
jgi:uncharacterized damage-inducible protein DinB